MHNGAKPTELNRCRSCTVAARLQYHHISCRIENKVELQAIPCIPYMTRHMPIAAAPHRHCFVRMNQDMCPTNAQETLTKYCCAPGIFSSLAAWASMASVVHDSTGPIVRSSSLRLHARVLIF